MAEKHFQVTLPDEVLAGFGWQEPEVPHRIREALVMELVRLDRLSEAEAAEALGLDRWELLEIMAHYHVPAILMSSEEMKQEVAREAEEARGHDGC